MIPSKLVPRDQIPLLFADVHPTASPLSAAKPEPARPRVTFEQMPYSVQKPIHHEANEAYASGTPSSKGLSQGATGNLYPWAVIMFL